MLDKIFDTRNLQRIVLKFITSTFRLVCRSYPHLYLPQKVAKEQSFIISHQRFNLRDLKRWGRVVKCQQCDKVSSLKGDNFLLCSEHTGRCNEWRGSEYRPIRKRFRIREVLRTRSLFLCLCNILKKRCSIYCRLERPTQSACAWSLVESAVPSLCYHISMLVHQRPPFACAVLSFPPLSLSFRPC